MLGLHYLRSVPPQSFVPFSCTYTQSILLVMNTKVRPVYPYDNNMSSSYGFEIEHIASQKTIEKSGCVS